MAGLRGRVLGGAGQWRAIARSGAVGLLRRGLGQDGGSQEVEDNLVDLRRNLDSNGAAIAGPSAVQVRRLE